MEEKAQARGERAAEEEALLTLVLTPGIGPGRAGELLARWGSGREVLRRAAALRRGEGKGAPWLRALGSPGATARARRLHRALPGLGLDLLGLGLPGYPARLARLPGAPPLLFRRGSLDLARAPAVVAVVGSRTPTPYGRRVAEELAGGLAAAGVVVVSGLARGIDSHAHQATLQAGGRTLAVLAGGLERIYPPERQEMAARIAREGMLLSEMPPGTPLKPGMFPRRNRIISGLSDLVVIVEAGRRSGALTTAGWALDQGREVAAVPGPIHSPLSRGTLALIKDGAAVADSVESLLELLDLPPAQGKGEAEGREEDSPLLQALARAGGRLEEAAAHAGLPIEQALALVTGLELEGKVVQQGPGIYLPAGPPPAG